MTKQSERELDFVLWGATGFTGRLVAEYLVRQYGASAHRWALAGRSEPKLEELRDFLIGVDPSARELPIVIGDSFDNSFLADMAARARVVITTVGPYSRYGGPLVGACVEQGTHYCDLTGEVFWMRSMIEAHHERAAETGARIVHCCGFDAIPSDLGTLMVQERAIEQFGAPCSRITLHVLKSKGSFSGGTIASMMGVLETLRKNPEARKVMGNPYALNPAGEASGPDRTESQKVLWDEETSAWTAPFIMARTNTRIVRRSNALLGFPWGRDFSYGEVFRKPGRVKGWFGAMGLMSGLAAFGITLSLGPTRALMRRFVLPKPGEGPTRKEIEEGFFEMELVGRGPGGQTLRGTVIGERDPGYGETAKMLAESGLCLALQGDELDSLGGVLTPASAMGMTLVERLRKAGMTFSVS